MKRGQIVFSKAGRDCGRFMVVVKTEKCGIYVADGKERPLENPKLKNPKHLGATDYCLSEGTFSTNRSLRGLLRSIAWQMNSEKGDKSYV